MIDIPARFTVGLVIYNMHVQRYLILRRNPKLYKGWGLVKGGIDHNETPEQACLRETLEEVGIRITSDSLVNLAHKSAYFDNTKKLIVLVEWFFVALDAPVDIKLEIDEWVEYRWATFDEALYELTWQSQQRALRAAHERVLAPQKFVEETED